MTRYVSFTPQASLLLHSLRSVGYSEEAAVADIVDNAIAADANEIHINFDWENREIVILDNGQGMKQQDLYKNMQIGSSDPNLVRSNKDLGRFGMGMKTAAFSLGRKLIVVTSDNGTFSNAAWDLDQVADKGWNLLVEDNEAYSEYLTGTENHGTAVIIRKLDTLVDESNLAKSKKNFYAVIRHVLNHLELVFHRFIQEDGLKIFINNNGPLVGWDPFITSSPATQELSDEEIYDPEYRTRTYIQPYVLPHKTKFSSDDEYKKAGGFKGWNRHQGIYLYRNRRLIIYGTWFDLIRKEPAFSLARIRIDISSDADADWKIDIKKSRASLPVYLRERILSSVDDCTTRSMRVFNSRGTYSKHGPSAANLDFVWEQRRTNGIYSFKINKKHPLLAEIRKQLDDGGKNCLRTYLALIENFAPFMRNGILNTVNASEAAHDEEQRKADLTDIKKYISVFYEQGFSKQEILDTILNMKVYAYLKDDVVKLVGEFND